MAPVKKPAATKVDPKLAKYLKDANKNWGEGKKIQEEKFGGKRVEAGRYVSVLIAAELGIVAEKLAVKPQWEIAEGEFKGTKLYENTLWLHTPGSQAFFANWLAVLGYDLEDLDGIQDTLNEMVKTGTFALVRAKEKDDSEYLDVSVIRAAEKPEEYDEEPIDEEPEVTGDEFDGMDRNALKVYIKTNGLDITVVKSMSDDDIRSAVREAMGEAMGEPEQDADEAEPEVDDTEPTGDHDDEEVDLETMDAKQLRALIEADNLVKEIPGYKKMAKADLIEAIQSLDNDAEPEEDDAEPEDEDDGLNDMDRNALKKVIASESLSVKVVKSMSDDDIREAIRTERDSAEPEEDDTEPDDAEPDFELTPAAFKRFCENQGITPKKPCKTQDQMKAFIAEFEYPMSDLKKGDQDVIDGLNLSELLVK